MFRNLARLFRYRGLIQSLVARELKARYRGSVLGFFWSFINPLLAAAGLLLRLQVHPAGGRSEGIEHYALFMFCGILPWTWFASSLTESSSVLISGGNLIKKVLFPAEILPIVTVLANMVHFFFGLPILAVFLIYFKRAADMPASCAVSRSSCSCSSCFTLGFALILSALTVHFRDIRDILSNLLTFWFFATPIIYPYFLFRTRRTRPHGVADAVLEAEPVHAPGDHVPGDPVLRRAGRPPEAGCSCSARCRSLFFLFALLRVRPAAGYVRGGGVRR